MLTSADLLAALTAIAKRGYMDHESGPWTLDDWALTTDGHIALLVPRQSLDALPPTPEKIATPVRRWLSLSSTPQRLEIAKLRAFATGPTCDRCRDTKRVPCDECDGFGGGTCECAKCGDEHKFVCDCEGGKMTCPDCDGAYVGLILGKKINMRLIADVLDIVADERDIDAAVVNLSPTKSGRGHAGDALLLKPHDGEPWIAFVMPMVDDTPAVCAYDEPAHVSRP